MKARLSLILIACVMIFIVCGCATTEPLTKIPVADCPGVSIPPRPVLAIEQLEAGSSGKQKQEACTQSLYMCIAYSNELTDLLNTYRKEQ